MNSQRLKLSIAGKDAAEADRYAGELRQAILDAAPPGTAVSRLRGDPEAMQFGEAIVLDVTAAVIAHAVVEGIKLFLHLRKVPIRLDVGGEPIVVDQGSPDLAATITNYLAPITEQT
jgi:hypothetical protein